MNHRQASVETARSKEILFSTSRHILKTVLQMQGCLPEYGQAISNKLDAIVSDAGEAVRVLAVFLGKQFSYYNRETTTESTRIRASEEILLAALALCLVHASSDIMDDDEHEIQFLLRSALRILTDQLSAIHEQQRREIADILYPLAQTKPTA